LEWILKAMADSPDYQKSSAASARPLSPHLQVYRLTLTMMMSIVHRITGAALYAGTLLLAWWLIALATGPEAFACVQAVMGSWVGKFVLLGFTWSLIHHALGGVRHFVWDTGAGLDPRGREFWTQFTIIGSVLLTIVVWGGAYILKPGVVL
jgi:succinate dehydrogenase / fumarate reductase cytochrome b subunit